MQRLCDLPSDQRRVSDGTLQICENLIIVALIEGLLLQGVQFALPLQLLIDRLNESLKAWKASLLRHARTAEKHQTAFLDGPYELRSEEHTSELQSPCNLV